MHFLGIVANSSLVRLITVLESNQYKETLKYQPFKALEELHHVI